jgi:hypothetical protein
MTEHPRPYGSTRFFDVTLPTIRARALETRLAANGRVVSIERRSGLVGNIDVVVEFAERQPFVNASTTTEVQGLDGDLIGRVGELDAAKQGDVFMLDGNRCEILIDPIEDRGQMLARFRMTVGR